MCGCPVGLMPVKVIRFNSVTSSLYPPSLAGFLTPHIYNAKTPCAAGEVSNLAYYRTHVNTIITR